MEASADSGHASANPAVLPVSMPATMSGRAAIQALFAPDDRGDPSIEARPFPDLTAHRRADFRPSYRQQRRHTYNRERFAEGSHRSRSKAEALAVLVHESGRFGASTKHLSRFPRDARPSRSTGPTSSRLRDLAWTSISGTVRPKTARRSRSLPKRSGDSCAMSNDGVSPDRISRRSCR